jgi:hypothetical protein
MAWEQRQGGFYFYRSYRRGGKVRKRYLGRGPQATAAAQEIAQAKARRDSQRQELKQLQATLQPLDGAADELNEGTEALLGALLRSCGYYEHRGAWRRRRVRQSITV